jgi:peptide/nickel transport system permease protein
MWGAVGKAFARRLAFAVPTLLAVVLAIFLLFQLAPGDPATSSLGTIATPAQRERFVKEHKLDRPIHERAAAFLADAVKGDLGDSLVQTRSVTELLGQRIPVTLQLTAVALVFGLLFGLLGGTLAAVRQDSWLDRGISSLSAGGLAAPDFWIGLMAIQLLAIQFQIFPAGGLTPFGEDPVAWLHSILLPALVLAIPLGSAFALMLRTALTEELDKDYVRTHRGVGLRPATILFRDVLRNALIAPVTVLGLRIGYLLTGAIVVEQVFAIQGLGTLTIDAVNQGDINVLQGVAITVTVTFILVNLVVDMIYLMLNPKLRTATA